MQSQTMRNKVHPLVLLFKRWAVSSTRFTSNRRLYERLCVLVAVLTAQCANRELLRIMVVNNQNESKDSIDGIF